PLLLVTPTPTPLPPLLPYTTLFRSGRRLSPRVTRLADDYRPVAGSPSARAPSRCQLMKSTLSEANFTEPSAMATCTPPGWRLRRSEEHTSELQSRENLVCRLLLEKK